MVKRLLVVCLMIFSILALVAEVKYSSLRVNCPNDIQLKKLLTQGFDVMVKEGVKNNQVKVIANQYDRQKLNQLGYTYDVEHEDITAFLKTRFTQPSVRNNQIGQGSMSGYFTYTEIVDFVDSLHTAYPNIMSAPVTIGQTAEGHSIQAYKISDNPNSNESEPEVLITGMHHAREPMSIVAPLYYTQWLLENYNTNELATYLVNEREIWIVPILNIDGYLYNQQIAPQGGDMWRKNKRDNNNNGVFNSNFDGVDINRNYGFEWGYDNEGSSPEPSAETYRGPSAFSELESQAIRDFCIDNNFRTALNFHTFGDLFIYSGHANGDNFPDIELFREYGDDSTKDNGYTYGNDVETVNYSTNGGSDNWMYGDQTQKPKIITFTPEIGDQLDYFWAPTSRIMPLAQENLFPQQYISMVAGPYLAIQKSRVNDSTGGDGDMSGEAGETFNFIVKVRNKGYMDALSNVTATLSSSNPMVTINNASSNITSINPLSEAEFTFNISLSTQLASGTTVAFDIHFNGSNNYIITEHFNHTFGSPIVLFFDGAENGMANWVTNQTWNTSNEKAAHGEFSFTDSPHAEYLNNTDNKITLANPIDLSFANNAFLKYQIRWNLERHFDKVQIQLLNNSNSWINADGEYTTYGTGAGVQETGEPVYNGFKDIKWSDETIQLNNVLNNNFKFRYSLESDEGVTADGVYVDDVMVVAYTDNPMPPVIAYVRNISDNTDFLGPYEIKAIISDAQGISSAVLKYSTDNSIFYDVNMTDTEKNFYSASIPMMELGTTVYYKVSATDQSNNTVNSPIFSFMVSSNPPIIATTASVFDFVVQGSGNVQDTFEISNNGILPLDFNIIATPIIPTRSSVNPTEALKRIQNIKSAEFISSDQKVKETTRDPQLIIQDTTDELSVDFRDIESIYAELVNNEMNITVNMADNVNWQNTLLVISFDTDQNINTGNYPPSFGVGLEEQNIGSDYELVVDAGNQIGNGAGAFIISYDGNSLIGLADMTPSANSIQLTFDYSLLQDTDNNCDVTAVSLISQTSNAIDYAPNMGHGTIGLPGSPSWLGMIPNQGHLGSNESVQVTVNASGQYLTAGTYMADMHIMSNDPVTPEIIVPVSMIVNPNSTEENPQLITDNHLFKNYPNPFNPETNIRFNVAKDSRVKIEVFNIKGQKVSTLTDRMYSKGGYQVIWNGKDANNNAVGSGIYFYKMSINNQNISTQKMMLIK
ncbi:MAG TPA: M14 family zinc carboxypeptidase [Candidatus Cloacimonadota bacterium]|nr:M14 family zinc carboxypeptidase [Candidatus Cloacimonadota bacterium]